MKPEIWDDINNVGLRNHYFCTVYAARLMVQRKQGLIINISSYGGIKYLFNVAYGIGKVCLK
jgi:dehydrogenase/reductase SDR family protein 1